METNLPATIKVTEMTDLTVPIKASVSDVEFELMLTVVLVILVIFLFLRSVRATIIPAVAVPISLVGTLGAMYVLGYSLDNLSMMALTIATGFVVDDAIVMIENISRFLEEGDAADQAALKGAEQIGFTIMSLTISLIAVLIPLLFMGDVVGRLFREFAVTLAVTIIISAVVSLTLTPMMCARLLHFSPAEQQSRFYRVSERAFERLIGFYGRTLKVVLRYQTLTMLVALATLILTIFLYIIAPKGFFPVQDTGVIQGISQAPETISFPAMAQLHQQLAQVILADPAVQSLTSFIGADGTNTTLNSGRFSINLKPLAQRDLNASDVIRRLQGKLKDVQGIRLYMQPVQNITVDDRVSRTQYQFTLEDPDVNELNTATNQFIDRLKKLPQLEDLASDQQTGGLAVSLVIDRVTASRLGIAPSTIDNTLYDAYGQRQINTLYTQLNQYHVILEAAAGFPARSRPSVQPLHPGQRRGRNLRRCGRYVLCGYRVGLCRYQRYYRRRCVYAFVRSSHRACRSVVVNAHGLQRRNGGHACQCRAAQRVHSNAEHQPAALHQPPGAVPGGHHLVQPCPARLAGQRHLRYRQGAAANAPAS